QPQEKGERGDDLKIQDRLKADAAHALHVAPAGDSHDQRPEQQRRDDRTDQPQEHAARRTKLPGEIGRGDSQEHSSRHADKDPGGERNTLHRSPHFSLECKTSKYRMRGGRTSSSEYGELRHTTASPSRKGVTTWPSIVSTTFPSPSPLVAMRM